MSGPAIVSVPVWRALALAAAAAATSVACSAGAEGSCLRKTDCAAPYTCVEGTCRTDEALAIAGPPADAGASDQ